MRITFFIGEFTEGGAERVISILANHMIEKGFDIEILKYHQTDNFYPLNEKIVVNSVEGNTHTRSNHLKNISWMHKHFQERDVVLSFLAPFNILSLLANFNNKTKIIVADRNDPRFVPNSPFRRLLRDFLYRFADGVVVQTSNNKKYFSNYIQKKTAIIPNPIEIKKNKGIALKTKKENVIVQVARLEKQKNQEMLIDAFVEIKKKYSDYQLIIYGEGPYRSILEEKIKSNHMEKDILLPGQQKDILSKIASAKTYVCTSNYEGMSNSLIEALCIGLPVLSTKVSGTEDLINKTNGILYDINDTKKLIEELDSLLSDSSLQESLGTNATKLTDQLKTDVIVNRWIEVIQGII